VSALITLWFDDRSEWLDYAETLSIIQDQQPGIDLVISVDYPHEFNDRPSEGDYAVFVWGAPDAITSAVDAAKAEVSNA